MNVVEYAYIGMLYKGECHFISEGEGRESGRGRGGDCWGSRNCFIQHRVGTVLAADYSDAFHGKFSFSLFTGGQT